MVNIKKISKLVTIIASLGLLASAVLSLVSIDIRPYILVRKIGIIILALKIFFCELNIKRFSNEFPYMKNNIGKGLFIIFCGSILIQKNFNLEMIFGIILMVLGLIIIFMKFFEKKEEVNQ